MVTQTHKNMYPKRYPHTAVGTHYYSTLVSGEIIDGATPMDITITPCRIEKYSVAQKVEMRGEVVDFSVAIFAPFEAVSVMPSVNDVINGLPLKGVIQQQTYVKLLF